MRAGLSPREICQSLTTGAGMTTAGMSLLFLKLDEAMETRGPPLQEARPMAADQASSCLWWYHVRVLPRTVERLREGVPQWPQRWHHGVQALQEIRGNPALPLFRAHVSRKKEQKIKIMVVEGGPGLFVWPALPKVQQD